MQSKKDLTIDDSLKIDVGLMRYDQRGGGRDAKKIINALSKNENNTIRLKRSMVYLPVIEVKFILIIIINSIILFY